MLRMRIAGAALAALAFLAALGGPAHAGKIVVAHDEWTLSYFGFVPPSEPEQFADNVCRWFTGGRNGRFLVYTYNFGLAGEVLANAMRSRGHEWILDTSGPTSVELFRQYDGVFLAVPCIYEPDVLAQYVRQGGNIYLCGGTAEVTDPDWNPFLSQFGLSFASQYNYLEGHMPILSDHPIFHGVSSLYHDNGSSIYPTQPENPDSQILVTHGSDGLYAVYDSGTVEKPIVKITSRDASQPTARQANTQYRYRLWGRVSASALDSFTISDGSAAPVTVIAAGHGAADGEFVTASGELDVTVEPLTLYSAADWIERKAQ